MSAQLDPLTPRLVPTMYFIGVTTAKSSIMPIFPKWAELMGFEAELVGYDAPLHAPAEVYRAIVNQIKSDPLVRGALVTTHKLDLLAATRDLFDELDGYAELCAEISCISKRNGRLMGHAKDPISSGLTWQSMVEPGHWERTGGQVLCFGGGGAAVAISVYVASLPDPVDRPRKFIVTELNETRLDHLRAIHAQFKSDLDFEYILGAEPRHNDALLASLPPGSLVINATGMGKDRPGSPITGAGLFPDKGLVWELNYRGELEFLRQAQRQAEERGLKVRDGWVYFLHGWTQVIAEIFQVQLTPKLFAALDEAAASLR